ncbi:MAG TPA: flavin reductase [Lentisphaeria bacterium]|nr:MAG: flavin reductase [Lentisphaerae bacterium GWF2_38_69]HBM16808.1 flavin reductase [Lentisphaeria bacterium]
MGKVEWKPGTMVYPIPAVMVSCGNKDTSINIITVAWTGTICSDPPMCYISVRPERHSHGIIKQCGDFVINLTTKKLAYATDWCGVKSGREFDKFKEMNLTQGKARKISSPIIEESPISIECVVKEIKTLGSHDMFISEVVSINADEKYYNKENDFFNFAKANPICYSHGKYYTLGELVGKFGYSVRKKR